MSERGHDHWSDDLGAYLLGALEPGEATELERHLEHCERCRAELRWLEPAVGRLPEGVERLEPSPALRDRLMSEVRADAAEAPQPQQLPSWLRRLWAGPYGWKPLAGLAAVLLVLVAVAGYQVGSGGDGGGERTISAGQAPGVTAEMVQEGDGGTLRLAGVEQLPPDRVLEAWVLRDGEVEAVPALFVPDHEGRAATTIADMDGVEEVMVTEEPQGGSEAPTGEPIVAMSVE